jgi:hypothetical protein
MMECSVCWSMMAALEWCRRMRRCWPEGVVDMPPSLPGDAMLTHDEEVDRGCGTSHRTHV